MIAEQADLSGSFDPSPRAKLRFGANVEPSIVATSKVEPSMCR